MIAIFTGFLERARRPLIEIAETVRRELIYRRVCLTTNGREMERRPGPKLRGQTAMGAIRLRAIGAQGLLRVPSVRLAAYSSAQENDAGSQAALDNSGQCVVAQQAPGLEEPHSHGWRNRPWAVPAGKPAESGNQMAHEPRAGQTMSPVLVCAASKRLQRAADSD